MAAQLRRFAIAALPKTLDAHARAVLAAVKKSESKRKKKGVEALWKAFEEDEWPHPTTWRDDVVSILQGYAKLDEEVPDLLATWVDAWAPSDVGDATVPEPKATAAVEDTKRRLLAQAGAQLAGTQAAWRNVAVTWMEHAHHVLVLLGIADQQKKADKRDVWPLDVVEAHVRALMLQVTDVTIASSALDRARTLHGECTTTREVFIGILGWWRRIVFKWFGATPYERVGSLSDDTPAVRVAVINALHGELFIAGVRGEADVVTKGAEVAVHQEYQLSMIELSNPTGLTQAGRECVKEEHSPEAGGSWDSLAKSLQRAGFLMPLRTPVRKKGKYFTAATTVGQPTATPTTTVAPEQPPATPTTTVVSGTRNVDGCLTVRLQVPPAVVDELRVRAG